jgi:hypothetical protein
MDKLKDYLLRHRSELDVDSPASDTWEPVVIPARPKSSAWAAVAEWAASRWVASAACVIVLAGIGLWLLIARDKAPADVVHAAKSNGGAVMREPAREKDTTGHPLLREEKTPGTDIARNAAAPKRVRGKGGRQKPAEPADAGDAIDAIDKSYTSLIRYQLRKLRATPLYAESSSYFSFYIQQFKQMDQDEQQVRNDIKTYGLTSELLDQLINVYQQKLNVLKNLETEINKMNNKVREKAAPSAKTEVYYLDI